MRIREANGGDVARIVELNHALFREDGRTRDVWMNVGWPQEEGEAYFSGIVSGTGSICLLAEECGETVGYLVGRLEVGTSLRPVEVAELESMYIEASYRRCGIGSALVRKFVNWAWSRDAEVLSVSAYAQNEAAISFYKNFGFLPHLLSLEVGRDQTPPLAPTSPAT